MAECARTWCEGVARESGIERVRREPVYCQLLSCQFLRCDIAIGIGSVDVDDVARFKAAAT